MSNTAKIVVYVILGLIAFVVISKVVSAVMALVVPLAIVAGIGLVLYTMINRRALGGGKRYLP